MQASLVNHTWYALASTDEIWRPLCYARNSFVSSDSISSEQENGSVNDSFKILNSKCSHLSQIEPFKWKKYYIALSRRVLVAYFANTSHIAATHGIKERLEKEGVRCGKFPHHISLFSQCKSHKDCVLEGQNSWVESLVSKLGSYGVLLLGANSTLAEPQRHELGDALAAYVERGNVVIMSAFYNSWTGTKLDFCQFKFFLINYY